MLKKGTSKSALMVALATGNVIWGGTVVHAEEPSQAFTLDPMVVTAQRMETRDLDTPAAVTVISSEEIKKSGAVNVDTLLAQQIGFNGMCHMVLMGKNMVAQLVEQKFVVWIKAHWY